MEKYHQSTGQAPYGVSVAVTANRVAVAVTGYNVSVTVKRYNVSVAVRGYSVSVTVMVQVTMSQYRLQDLGS